MSRVRVKLQFNYPPPGGPRSRQLWMLVDVDHLRVVTDLSELIRARYYPGQRGALNLYLQDFLLPPEESAHLIRDNDVIIVQWHGHDHGDEDTDSDSHSKSNLSKKRSRHRCEEDAEESPTIISKKRKCELQRAGKHRSSKETLVLEEAEQEHSSQISRKKAKKKKKVLEESMQEEFPEVSSKRKKNKKHSEDLNSLKAAKKNMSAVVSNHETPTKKVKLNSGSTSHQEPSEMHPEPSIQLIGTKPIITCSYKKSPNKFSEIPHKPVNKANKDPPAKSSNQISSSDSESSSDQESNIKGKKPAKDLKARNGLSISKTKPQHELPAERVIPTSLSDSSATPPDQEFSTNGKKPAKGLNKASHVSVSKTEANHELPNRNLRQISSSDSSSSSSDHESSNKGKKPAKRLNNDGITAFINNNPRMGKDSSATYKGDTRKGGPVEDVTATPLNDTSRKPHEEIPPPGFNSNNSIIQNPPAVQGISSVVPSCVTDGCEIGDIQQGPVPNSGLYIHGKGRGINIPHWRNQRGYRFRGWGGQGKGRGDGTPFFHSYGSQPARMQELEEPATSPSKDPPEHPKKDYSTLPLLAAPPQLGKVIAFKILELSEDYSPELSDYKEGIVRSYDPVNEQIELDLLSEQKKREPGKFDLVYQDEGGKEIIEYAVPPDCKIVKPWSSLITPRLVMANGLEEGTLPQPT